MPNVPQPQPSPKHEHSFAEPSLIYNEQHGKQSKRSKRGASKDKALGSLLTDLVWSLLLLILLLIFFCVVTNVYRDDTLFILVLDRHRFAHGLTSTVMVLPVRVVFTICIWCCSWLLNLLQIWRTPLEREVMTLMVSLRMPKRTISIPNLRLKLVNWWFRWI